jgi:ribonuclease VapC
MIVDTSALVAILLREPNYEKLSRALLNSPANAISAATLVEFYAVADNRLPPAQLRRIDALLDTLNIAVVPFTAEHAGLARQAYRTFGRGSGHPAGLNLGDAFSYALAAATGEPLLYVGNDFSQTDLSPGIGG